MLNKKSMGLHWDVLLISLFISIGILYYSIASVNIPKVGEISLEMIKTLEKNSLIPSIIERVMNWINEKTPRLLDENKIFTLRSYCQSEDYKEKIKKNKQLLIGGFGHLEGQNTNCTINEDDLMQYFKLIFEGEYDAFRKKDIGEINLYLSKTIYTSSIGKEDEYFNIVNTSNGVELPINIKKKQIGKLIMKPVFKFPVDYAFDDKNKEVCIFSKDCGATCQDVVNKYSAKGYKIKEVPCNRYYDCNDGDDAKDDFGNYYTCKDGSGNDNYLCNGRCLPFCSSSDPNAVVDPDASTKCKEVSCNSYMSCGTINPTDKCWCPSSFYACEGSDCDTLHCERDPDENTHCRGISCGEYHDCSSTSLPCNCDSGLNECQGTCPLCWSGDWVNQGCESGKRKYTREVKPAGCTNDVAYDLYGCDAACDSCACNRGSYCGPCGHDACYSIGQCVTECSSCTNVWTCNAQPDGSCLSQTCGDLGCGQTDACGTYCGDCPPPEEPPYSGDPCYDFGIC